MTYILRLRVISKRSCPPARRHAIQILPFLALPADLKADYKHQRAVPTQTYNDAAMLYLTSTKPPCCHLVWSRLCSEVDLNLNL
jgi:hypothetical protein